MNIITSSQNQKIKDIIKLRKTNNRKKTDLFIIEGKKELELAINNNIQISSIYFCPIFLKEKTLSYNNIPEINELDEKTFKKISLRENPDGIIALAVPKYLKLNDIIVNKNPLILILESIEKPGNLGAIFRTADACGVDYIIISEAKTDLYNPNVIRSSLGTIFTNKIIICKNNEIFPWLKLNKITTFATTPDTDKIYTDVNFSGGVAIIIGTEHEGLSKTWLEYANFKIKIPMNGKIDSLNASVSAAIILFEAIRQRNIL